MKLIVYGRQIEVERSSGHWVVYYLGNEGKKRIAPDIIIPEALKGNEVESFLEDLLHEYEGHGVAKSSKHKEGVMSNSSKKVK